VRVRAVLRVSYDGYSARRRRRHIHAARAHDAAGELTLTVIVPQASSAQWPYAIVLLLAGVAVYLQR
jgi:hypothetical protein